GEPGRELHPQERVDRLDPRAIGRVVAVVGGLLDQAVVDARLRAHLVEDAGVVAVEALRALLMHELHHHSPFPHTAHDAAHDRISRSPAYRTRRTFAW